MSLSLVTVPRFSSSKVQTKQTKKSPQKFCLERGKQVKIGISKLVSENSQNICSMMKLIVVNYICRYTIFSGVFQYILLLLIISIIYLPIFRFIKVNSNTNISATNIYQSGLLQVILLILKNYSNYTATQQSIIARQFLHMIGRFTQLVCIDYLNNFLVVGSLWRLLTTSRSQWW